MTFEFRCRRHLTHAATAPYTPYHFFWLLILRRALLQHPWQYCALRISTYAPLRISTYAPFMKDRKFYHDNMITWPRSPLIHRQSPQILSQKPFFYVKIIAHLPPYSFPSPFQKDREKTSECGGRPAVTLRGLAVNLRRSRGQPYLWFMSMLSLWVRWRRHRNSNVT